MEPIIALTIILVHLLVCLPNASVTRMNKNTVTMDPFLWPPPLKEEENSKLTKISNTNPQTIVQVSILLPTHEHKYPDVKLEPAQNKSGPGILAGFQRARDLGILPNDVIFNITFRDSRCDNTYAPKSFIDARFDGVEVLFGPSCEYALGKQFSYHSSFDPKIQ